MNAPEKFLRYIFSLLLKKPEEVTLTSEETDKEIHFKVNVAKQDLGALIGRRGRTITAIRALLQVAAGRSNKHATLLVQEEESQLHSESQDSEEEAPR